MVFYNSTNQGEKVQISDLTRIPKDQPLLCGEPFCAPPNETMAQGYIDHLRGLYRLNKRWTDSIESFVLTHLRCDVKLEELENLDLTRVNDVAERLTKELWPLLAFINGSIIETPRIGSKVKIVHAEEIAANSHEGFILGMTSAKTGHIKISGLPSGILVQKGHLQSLETPDVACLHHLLSSRTLKLLHILTAWSGQLQKLLTPKSPDEPTEDSKRKRSKKANEDMVSMLLTREKKRSSSLPESRASGVEQLTDQLVSSILGEITGLAKSSHDNILCSDDEQVKQPSKPLKLEPSVSASEKDEEVLQEDIALKMADLQTMACLSIVNFLQNSTLYSTDSDVADVCSLIIRDAVREISAKIEDSEVKAKAFKPHFKVLSMIGAGFARRAYLDKMMSPNVKSLKPSRLPPLPTSFVASAWPSEEASARLAWAFEALFLPDQLTPIHLVLQEMGFEPGLISEALRTLNLDGTDTSAQAINQCATWMIDHQARPNQASAIRSAQDIRHYFSTSGGQPRRSVPPWVSSFQGSLTPVQQPGTRPTRMRRAAGSANVSIILAYYAVLRSCMVRCKLCLYPFQVSSDEAQQQHLSEMAEQCCICLQRIVSNLRQHILQSHKGCGGRLLDRTESCGDMFDGLYWLCCQCLAELEVRYSNFCINWHATTNCSVRVRTARRLKTDQFEGKRLYYLSFGFII